MRTISHLCLSTSGYLSSKSYHCDKLQRFDSSCVWVGKSLLPIVILYGFLCVLQQNWIHIPIYLSFHATAYQVKRFSQMSTTCYLNQMFSCKPVWYHFTILKWFMHSLVLWIISCFHQISRIKKRVFLCQTPGTVHLIEKGDT